MIVVVCVKVVTSISFVIGMTLLVLWDGMNFFIFLDMSVNCMFVMCVFVKKKCDVCAV